MTRFLPLLLFAPLLALTALAQPALDFNALDAHFTEAPSVEVNLQGSLLRLAAAATAENEPEAAALIKGLNTITVRIYPLSSARGPISENLVGIGAQLEREGWYTFVRVRGTETDGEDVWIYVRDEGDAFGGLTVMALDPEEDHAVFVFIDGFISPEDIGRLSSRFGNVGLDDLDVGVDLDLDVEED